MKQYRALVQELLTQVGIASQHLCFLVAQDVSQIKKHTNQIKKQMESINTHQVIATNQLDIYSKKISEILM